MQVGSGSGDFIGWGTARGLGTHDPNAASNCPDDYTSGWHVYIDGTKFGVYFCRQTYGTVSGNANDQLFTLKYGSCNGLVRWRAVLNGDLKTCQIIDGDDANVAVVGGEVIGTTGQLHVDIHYDDLLRYYSPTDYWYMWHFDDASECTSLGYRLRFIAADDVWIEEIP